MSWLLPIDPKDLASACEGITKLTGGGGLQHFAAQQAAKQYTQSDLDAAVAAERERCAAICNGYSRHLLNLDPFEDYEHEAHAAEACYHLIMGRNEYGDEPDSEHFGDSYGAAIRNQEKE